MGYSVVGVLSVIRLPCSLYMAVDPVYHESKIVVKCNIPQPILIWLDAYSFNQLMRGGSVRLSGDYLKL